VRFAPRAAFLLGLDGLRTTRGVDFRPSLGGPFVGEVQAGKLAVDLDRLAIVCPRRFDLVGEVATTEMPPPAMNVGMVLGLLLHIANTHESGG